MLGDDGVVGKDTIVKYRLSKANFVVVHGGTPKVQISHWSEKSVCRGDWECSLVSCKK